LLNADDYQKDPFSCFTLDETLPEVRLLKFSANGSFMLCATAESTCLIIDAYDGKPIKKITSISNETNLPIEVSFTPDS
jgi:hypothetical protein